MRSFGLHEPFRADEWLLHVTGVPWAGGSRGFTRGQIFSADGRLVASTAQEGLIRKIRAQGEGLYSPNGCFSHACGCVIDRWRLRRQHLRRMPRLWCWAWLDLIDGPTYLNHHKPPGHYAKRPNNTQATSRGRTPGTAHTYHNHFFVPCSRTKHKALNG